MPLWEGDWIQRVGADANEQLGTWQGCGSRISLPPLCSTPSSRTQGRPLLKRAQPAVGEFPYDHTERPLILFGEEIF